MSMDGQGIKWRRNIAENFNRLSTVHKRYRQTDGRATAYSERSLKTCICVRNWATMWHRLHNRLNPFTQIISILPHFVLRIGVLPLLVSWFVRGGVSAFVLGWRGLKKMPSTLLTPPPEDFFSWTALKIYVINCVSTQAARFVLIYLILKFI